jgi:uncharacterized phage protein gp47/JayE
MPLAIPSLADLRTQTRAQFISRISGTNPRLRRMLVNVFGDTVAGGLWLLYRFLVRLSQQLFLDTAETVYLERQASIDGISRLASAPAAGTATFLGAPDGIPVPAGLLLQNADASAQYTTQVAGVLASGSVTLPVVAVAGGAAGNANAGDPLTLMVAIAGVQPTATVASGGLTGGLDAESDDGLRARALDHRRSPPQGGDANDYVQWATGVAGVTRAWCFPLNRGPGTVDVAFVMDARADIIPLTADVAAVQATIDAVKPVTADCIVFALATDAIAITIHNLVPNTPVTQAAVLASLGALFATTTPGGATIGAGVSAGVPGGTLYLEQVIDAVAQSGGIRGFEMTAPSASILSGSGHVARLGAVTFT